MRKPFRAAGTSTFPHLSRASTLPPPIRRPFLGTHLYTSNLTREPCPAHAHLGGQCPPSRLPNATPSISTDGRPPLPATPLRSLWNTFPSGERPGWGPRSSLPGYPLGAGVNHQVEANAEERGAGGTGSIGAMTIDRRNTDASATTRATSCAETRSLENLRSTVSPLYVGRFDVINNIICPPASFLSPGERFIAQEQCLEVQLNNVGAAVGSDRRLNVTCSGVSSQKIPLKLSRVSSFPQNFQVNQTRMSQMYSGTTISSSDTTVQRTARTSATAGQEQPVSLGIQKVLDQRKVVECDNKSDVTQDRAKEGGGNDSSPTSPSSSSPETQVEDLSKKVEPKANPTSSQVTKKRQDEELHHREVEVEASVHFAVPPVVSGESSHGHEGETSQLVDPSGGKGAIPKRIIRKPDRRNRVNREQESTGASEEADKEYFVLCLDVQKFDPFKQANDQ